MSSTSAEIVQYIDEYDIKQRAHLIHREQEEKLRKQKLVLLRLITLHGKPILDKDKKQVTVIRKREEVQVIGVLS